VSISHSLLAYSHHGGGGSGLGQLFGLVAAVSVGLRFMREFSINPLFAVLGLVGGYVVYRVMTRGRRSRRS
jgi:hypothetical protein